MRTFILFLLLFAGIAFAESGPRSMAIMPTTDTSDMGIAKPLQNALGVLAQDSGYFTVQYSDDAIPGFTKGDIATAFHRVHADVLGFVYVETGRLSIFLFDSARSGEFALAFEMLTPADGKMTNTYVEQRFRAAWASVLNQYVSGHLQPLPGSQPNEQQLAQTEEQQYKAMEAKKLFREIASLEDRSYYAGANVGMARFGAEGTSASTVNVGALIGARLGPRMNTELGFDMFSYVMPHLDLRYTLPLEDRHVFLSASLGVGSILGSITRNRGFASTTLKTGSPVFGPGVCFDIPLLGVNLRGDIRFYVGSATILLGTYGIVYAL